MVGMSYSVSWTRVEESLCRVEKYWEYSRVKFRRKLLNICLFFCERRPKRKDGGGERISNIEGIVPRHQLQGAHRNVAFDGTEIRRNRKRMQVKMCKTMNDRAGSQSQSERMEYAETRNQISRTGNSTTFREQ